MLTKSQRNIIQESRRDALSGSKRILSEKISNYHKLILTEGFFDKVKQLGQGVASGVSALGREMVPGFKGHGGATTANLSSELPEMKQLKANLGKVEQLKNKLVSMKLTDIKGIDAALDTYVQALVDTFGQWKHVTENPKESNKLPEVVDAVTSAFASAKSLIAGLMRAFDDANEVLRHGVPSDSTVASRSAIAPPQRPQAPTDALTAGKPSRPAARKLSAV